MTDPLARIEAMIETLGSREARFWTPLDTSQEQVSNPKALENCGFGQFGQFGHPTQKTIDDDLVGEHGNAPDGDAKHRKSRARRVLFRELSKVSKVSKTIKKTSHIKGLLLDTWRLQVSKIGGQVSKTPQASG